MLRKTLITLLALSASTVALASEGELAHLYIVHFQTGARWDAALEPVEQSGFKEHSANLNRLRKAGVIVFGARYGDLGLIVLKAESLGAATELMQADPGVASGIFDVRIEALNVFYPWRHDTG